MIKFTEDLPDIEEDFKEKEIPIDEVGFYDHPNFQKVEKENPEFLNNYARFVGEKDYDESYLNVARKEIPVIAEAVYSELMEGGRQGACVDTAGILTRCLECEGYWNYVIKGSLTLEFPIESGISKRYFFTVDEGDFVAAHAWICAPPFKVIDLTILQQEHSSEQNKYVPDFVVAEDAEMSVGSVEDVIAPEITLSLRSNGVPKNRMFEAINPSLVKFFEVFPAWEVETEGMKLKYIPTAITAPDRGLDGMFGISEEGRTGVEIYEQLVTPALEKVRTECLSYDR